MTWSERSTGSLRGCIGAMQAKNLSFRELAEDMVVAAARSDPRFAPIPSEDFPRLNLSVTVLGEEWPWPAPREPEEIRVGVEGLHVRYEARSGVLLPQVARDWEYDGSQFLAATCRKADLEADAWERPEVEVFRFRGWEHGGGFLEILDRVSGS